MWTYIHGGLGPPRPWGTRQSEERLRKADADRGMRPVPDPHPNHCCNLRCHMFTSWPPTHPCYFHNNSAVLNAEFMPFEAVCKILCVGEYENFLGWEASIRLLAHTHTHKVKNNYSDSNESLLHPHYLSRVQALVVGVLGYWSYLLRGLFASTFISVQSGLHRALKVTFLKLCFNILLWLCICLQMKFEVFSLACRVLPNVVLTSSSVSLPDHPLP